MTKSEPRIADFGTVSSCTMRTEDLIPAFADALEYLSNGSSESHTKLVAKANDVEDFDSDDAHKILSELFDALNKYAPAYGYFGANEGDGADYGFWLSDALGFDFDGLKVDDLSEVPEDYTGEVLETNDHGNLTLYSVEGGKFTEIWAV